MERALKQFRSVRRLMERMLLRFSRSMTRKVLALVIILITSSLAPATAVLGFCAKMPCCFAEEAEGPVLTVNMAGCCTTISCYEAPSHELVASAKAKTFTATAPATLPVLVTMPQTVTARRTCDDTSPPPTTSERLSSLSVFII